MNNGSNVWPRICRPVRETCTLPVLMNNFDKIILSATKFIKFSSQNVLSPIYSKLNEFHGGRNPVRLS